MASLRPALFALTALSLAACAAPTLELPAEQDLVDMGQAAEAAERTMGVPANLVLAIAYAETRWQTRLPEDNEGAHHEHAPETVGVGGLKPWLEHDPVGRASRLLGVDAETIHRSAPVGILATAAVLWDLSLERHGTPPPSTDVGAWAEVVGDFSGESNPQARESYIEDVFSWVRRGITDVMSNGRSLVVLPMPVTRTDQIGASRAYGGASYPGARWVPAHSSNYSSRRGEAIQYVVVHTTQGSYSGAVSWFGNAMANVSAHFVVRSSDGEVTQMLSEQDNGWHAGNSTYNRQSIGIEHEGFVADPGRWYTDAMYRSSANLTRYICDKYGIPKTRARIIGHVEVPRATHTDPGTGWDWDRYMALVTEGGSATAYDAEYVGQDAPAEMVAGERAVVWFEYRNTGSATWDRTNTKMGTTGPRDRSSLFFDAENWLTPVRPSEVDHSDYGAGATGRLTFLVTAPEVDTTTVVSETFGLVQEGLTWFGPEDAALSITVHPRSGPVVDSDGDGSSALVDCDDADASRYPGATEICGDGIDQDCTAGDLACGTEPTMPPTAPPVGGPTEQPPVGGPAGRSGAGLESGCSATRASKRWTVGFAFVFAVLARRRRRR